MPRRGDYGELSSTARARKTTPQHLWQLRMVRAGKCAQCGEPREKGLTWFCRACAAANGAASAERVALLAGEPDAYSLWCAGTLAREVDDLEHDILDRIAGRAVCVGGLVDGPRAHHSCICLCAWRL